MRIKCAVANTRANVILEIDASCSFKELKTAILTNTVISEAIGSLNENKIAVFSTGFPLKRLPDSGNVPISELGITSGTLITLSIETAKKPEQIVSSSIPPQLPASLSSWTCESCTLINSMATTNCTTCGFAYNNASSSWACLSCTFLNKSGFLCEICGANKPPVEEPLIFQRHEVPSDNSCLFHAVGLISGIGDATRMRNIAANLIDKDSSTFSDAILGQSREKYKKWILEPTSWGGAIELGVLSSALGLELVAIEVRGGQVYRFGQGLPMRGFLVFDGVHYDVICAKNNCQTKYLFNNDDSKAQSSAIKIVDELRRLHQFVDVSSFSIVCSSCNLPLRGEAEARAHATATNHTDFTESKSTT